MASTFQSIVLGSKLLVSIFVLIGNGQLSVCLQVYHGALDGCSWFGRLYPSQIYRVHDHLLCLQLGPNVIVPDQLNQLESKGINYLPNQQGLACRKLVSSVDSEVQNLGKATTFSSSPNLSLFAQLDARFENYLVPPSN